MGKNVLDVGQCTADHLAICRLIEDQFKATVCRATSGQQAFDMALRTPFDLILINRIIDMDGSEGLEILKEFKADPRTKSIPVMLVSNYHDAQTQAIEHGAVPGFGKANLGSQSTIDQLNQLLA